MKKLLFIILFAIFPFLSAQEELLIEHLEPSDIENRSPESKLYRENVFNLLNKNIKNQKIAYYVIPSFVREYGFSIFQKNNNYYIGSSVLNQSYYYSKNKNDVVVEVYKRKISEDFYLKIIELFNILETNSKPTEEKFNRRDGEDYYFQCIDDKGNTKMAKTWSPENENILYRVVKVCNDIFNYGNRRIIFQGKIEKELNILIEDLKKKYQN